MVSKRQQVMGYFINNPVNDSKPNKYKEVMKAFNITLKQASSYWIHFKNNYINTEIANYSEKEIKKIIKQEGDSLNISVNIDYEVKSLNDLLEACEVDAKKWEVVSWQCKKWDLGIKSKDQKIETKALYSVSAKFKAIPFLKNTEAQKEILLKELFKKSEKVAPIVYGKTNIKKDNLLELALFDMHFGKLAHGEESGEDYDIKIAAKRYISAVESLLNRINLSTVERILLPVGQDLLNVDNLQGTTTAGTPQDNDSRFYKVVRSVKNILIAVIEMLSKIAPVDVVVVVGNHDEQSTFMIGEMLDAYFHNDRNVSVFNTASLRKYYKYGIAGFMFTHGNREKQNDLGMIFAAENAELWASVKQRYIQIGHYHHNKKIATLQTQDFQGFQVQILPSLSGSDYWHTGKGFISLKQAKAFLYNKNEGLIGEFTYTEK